MCNSYSACILKQKEFKYKYVHCKIDIRKEGEKLGICKSKRNIKRKKENKVLVRKKNGRRLSSIITSDR